MPREKLKGIPTHTVLHAGLAGEIREGYWVVAGPRLQL